MKVFGEGGWCCVSELPLAALYVCVFAFKPGPALFKPSTWWPHSLCWPGLPDPPFPPAQYRGEPPLRPGSLTLGVFSSSLLLLLHLIQRPFLAQSPRHHPHPPPRPLCPGWLSQCRWKKGKKACGVAQPGWGPGDLSQWWRTQHQDLRENGTEDFRSCFKRLHIHRSARWTMLLSFPRIL